MAKPDVALCCGYQVAPRELLVPRGVLSPATLRLLKTPAFPMSIVAVTPGSEFPVADALASLDSYQVAYATLPNQLCLSG